MADATPDVADERFAANLRIWRERAGMSQADLAQAMADMGKQMHQQTIARIEGGQRVVSIGEADALARAVGANALALTRPRGLAQEAWALVHETRQANAAHAEALLQARKFASITERLAKRITKVEQDGHAEALADELAIARRAVALPQPLEREGS